MNAEWIQFVLDRRAELWERTVEHLLLTGVSTGLAIATGVPLGIMAFRLPRVRGVILGVAGVLQTIPSLAMLTLLLAALGKIGAVPAVVALTLYGLLPIVRNTLAGLDGVAPELIEAADGVGMTGRQRMLWVRLPLALPVIVAGIRTAAVIGVGVATLSAFIGAGGLGQFINRGLALRNTGLILLGAIPSAMLALAVDLLVGGAARLADPVKGGATAAATATWTRRAAIAVPAVLLLAAVPMFVGGGDEIAIGSKMFTENEVLGHMMAELIEDRTELSVERRFFLGGTMICHGALVEGEIDLYPEYTGTGLATVLHEPTQSDPEAVYEIVSSRYPDEFDVEWLAPFGLNNTYAFAVRREAAKEKGWTKVSDLKADAMGLRAGFPSEFMERDDGYPGFVATYEFEFGDVVDMEASLMYAALQREQVDVIAAYSTDGRIDSFGFVLLEDDRKLFPPYFAAPVIREETLSKYPALREVLAPLGGLLDDATMRRLNLQVDQEGREPRNVAREFLVEQGLLDGS